MLYAFIQSIIQAIHQMGDAQFIPIFMMLFIIGILTIAPKSIPFLLGLELLIASPWFACHTDAFRTSEMSFACSNTQYITFLKTNYHIDVWYIPFGYLCWFALSILIIWRSWSKKSRIRQQNIYYSITPENSQIKS